MSVIEFVGGPRNGETLAVRSLECFLRFAVTPVLEVHNKPVDYTPMRMVVYKHVPETLMYYFIGVDG